MDTCETCRFYIKAKCQRYPKPLAKKKTDWCGEHERKIFTIAPGAKKADR